MGGVVAPFCVESTRQLGIGLNEGLRCTLVKVGTYDATGRTLDDILSPLAGLLWPTVVRCQTLAGRFYPEKQNYFVGEPVFIDFEITNTGDQPAWMDQRMGEPCIEPDPMEVVGAKHQGFGWDTSL